MKNVDLRPMARDRRGVSPPVKLDRRANSPFSPQSVSEALSYFANSAIVLSKNSTHLGRFFVR
jgi:hypothetical protein